MKRLVSCDLCGVEFEADWQAHLERCTEAHFRVLTPDEYSLGEGE